MAVKWPELFAQQHPPCHVPDLPDGVACLAGELRVSGQFGSDLRDGAPGATLPPNGLAAEASHSSNGIPRCGLPSSCGGFTDSSSAVWA
jgi:hypothetical protein